MKKTEKEVREPMEFKILFEDEGQFPTNLVATVAVVNEAYLKHGDCIHVIEKSYADQLAKELEQVKGELLRLNKELNLKVRSEADQVSSAEALKAKGE